MTFPVVEIFCPECKEPMTLVNQPKIENTVFNREGYDQIVDYHYQCKSNERHEGKWHDFEGNIIPESEDPYHSDKGYRKTGKDEWCDISSERNITIMRILIPKLNSSDYDSVATTATVNMINIEKQMRDDGIKFHKSEPITNLLLNVPTGEITLEEIEKKAELVRKKYPDMTKYNLRFMRAGETAVMRNPLMSDEDAYIFFINIAEMMNPKKLNLTKKEYFNQLGNKIKSFMNDCLDIIINEDSLD